LDHFSEPTFSIKPISRPVCRSDPLWGNYNSDYNSE
jgi:hypothetical protein